jgi:hypothetical protein
MRGFGQLPYSVRTGESGFERHLGMPIFDWLARNPADASLFSETMVGFHGGEPPAVAAAYDFTGLGTIVDVGGATGNLLTTVLAAHPGTLGVLFDLPHVVRDARALIAARGVADRVTIESATSSPACRRAATSTCCRTSSTTGPRSGASRSSATVGVRCTPRGGCCSSRW